MSPNEHRSGTKFRGPSDRHAGVVSLILIALCAGCGQRQSGPVAQEQTNLGWLGSMYGMYIGQHKGETPKTIDDLRAFVEKTMTAEKLARLKVANVGELFISPRDGQPFTLVSYAKLPPPAGGQPAPVVLYETEGQNGRRAVAFLGGSTRTVDEQELQKLLPAQAKTGR